MILRFLPVLVLSGSATGFGAEVSSTATFVRSSRTTVSSATAPTRRNARAACGSTPSRRDGGGGRIRAIVPGDPAKSAAWERILSEDPDEVMPPPKSHKKLSAVQKDILRRWIEAGANYERHWSLVPVRSVPVPAVKQTAWPRGDLDRFLLARLEARGFPPRRRRRRRR